MISDLKLKLGPSKNKWCRPVIVVPKRDEMPRLCVDFSKHNRSAFIEWFGTLVPWGCAKFTGSCFHYNEPNNS